MQHQRQQRVRRWRRASRALRRAALVYFSLRSFARQRCREISVGARYASRLIENLARAAVQRQRSLLITLRLQQVRSTAAKPGSRPTLQNC